MTHCTVTLNWTPTKNATTYIWTGVAPSAVSCGGASLTPVVHMYVMNITGAYNEKEIEVTGTTTRTGTTVFLQNAISFPLVSTTQNPSTCDSTGCSSAQFGSVEFDWPQLVSFTPTYNNATDVLSVASVSSISATTTYVFDPVALDGSGKCGATSTTCNASLTTSNSPDVIIAVCGIPSAGTGSKHCTTPTATGLTFTFRAAEPDSTTNNVTEWYATDSSTFNGNIACNVSSSDNFGCNVFGISGANTGSPYDSNGALPAKNTGSASTPSVATVSTSNANDILIGMVESQGSTTQTGGTCASGTCTLIQSETNTPVTASEYLVVSSTQSSATVAFGTSTGASHAWAMIADAIKAASAVAYTSTVSVTISGSPKVVKDSVSEAAATVSIAPLAELALMRYIHGTISIVPVAKMAVVHYIDGAVSLVPSVTAMNLIIRTLAVTVSAVPAVSEMMAAIRTLSVAVSATPAVSQMRILIKTLTATISIAPKTEIAIAHIIKETLSISASASAASVILRFIAVNVNARAIVACAMTASYCGNASGLVTAASQSQDYLAVALMAAGICFIGIRRKHRKQ
jgi:hypothetical protein